MSAEAAAKDARRQEEAARLAGLGLDPGPEFKPPLFPGQGKAAERLRRQPEYLRARTVAVLPYPVLSQARVSVLNDNKMLIAASPGLKQGFVRLTAQMVPLPDRPRLLAANSLAQSGKRLRLPQSKLGRVDLLVGAGLAVDREGGVLGDGKGLFDLVWALLCAAGAIKADTPVAILTADEQLADPLPQSPWDTRANLIVTPSQALRANPKRQPPDLSKLPKKLAHLPVAQAIRGMGG